MQFIEELLLLLLLLRRLLLLLLLLHNDWWQYRFYFHFIVEWSSKVTLVGVCGTSEKAGLHEVDGGQCWWLKNGHYAAVLLRRDLRAFKMIWRVILVLGMRWKRGQIIVLMNCQGFNLHALMILRAQLIAHWYRSLLTISYPCCNCDIWYVGQSPLRWFAGLRHRLQLGMIILCGSLLVTWTTNSQCLCFIFLLSAGMMALVMRLLLMLLLLIRQYLLYVRIRIVWS